MTRIGITLALTLLGIVTACTSDDDGKKTKLSASDYDQTCSVDGDCVIISVGVCAECTCDFDAINAKDKAKYEHDEKLCDTDSVDCGPCLSAGKTVAFCDTGTCAVKLASDAGADGG